jgi:hypothetical protein
MGADGSDNAFLYSFWSLSAPLFEFAVICLVLRV